MSDWGLKCIISSGEHPPPSLLESRVIHELKPYPAYKNSGVPWLGEIPKSWGINPGFSVFREKQHKNTGMIETTVLSLSYGKIIVKPPEKLHGLVPASFETYQIIDPNNIPSVDETPAPTDLVDKIKSGELIQH